MTRLRASVSYFLAVIALLSVTLGGLAASADAGPHLDFLLTPGSIILRPGTLHCDAGILDVDRTPRWKHTFTLKNTTPQPLTLASLRGSCGCETLLLTKNGTRVPRVQLRPGETAEVMLDVRLDADQSGFVRKYVWVTGPVQSSGQAPTLATVEVDMALRQSVSFAPERLDFGKVYAGAGGIRTLTVTLDADLVSGSSLPPLTCADPSLHAALLGGPQKILVSGQPALRQQYSVSLSSSAPAGSLAATLRFQPSAGAGSADPLARPALSVTGLVAGALDAMPASVFFGSLPAGKAITRSVVLSLAAAQSVKSLSVVSSSRWLHATLDPAEAPSKHHLLTVTLTPQAPVGPVQEKITIISGTSTSGAVSRIEIPVVAELTK